MELPDRLEQSPNLTHRHVVSDDLRVSHAEADVAALPFLEGALTTAYRHAGGWFEGTAGVRFDFWVAPDLTDLQYMLCIPCQDGFFCSPGESDGWGAITALSPRAYRHRDRLAHFTSSLAHEVSHHIVQARAGATRYTLRRRDLGDLPMWVEEGLCQVVECAVDGDQADRLREQARYVEEWLSFEVLWNDLAACPNRRLGYLQAYHAVRALIAARGEQHVFDILSRNAERAVDWRAVAADARELLGPS
jgi:hypothetical protein